MIIKRIIEVIEEVIDPEISDAQFTNIYEAMIWMQIIGLALAIIGSVFSGNWILGVGLAAIIIPNILNMINVYMIFAPENKDANA